MRDFLSGYARDLKPSGIRKYFDIVETLEGAISLGVGEPDFVTPWEIRSAGIRSLQKGYTQYTGNRGLPELRALISRYLSERFGAEYPADRVIVTVGASEGIDLALRATCETGDEVLLPDPAYVSYSPIVHLCGGRAVSVKCRAENGFILTPEALEEAITPRTKTLVLAYPNNPTGGIMTKEQLEAIVPVIEKHDLLVISDEIYAELTYGGRHVSVASLGNMRERTVLLSGFSKAFAMTGWRVGFACAPKEIDSAMLKIHQYTALCAPRISQHAAVAALQSGFADGFSVVQKMREEYDRRRRFLVNALNGMGLTCFEPRGAFYVFPSVEKTGMTGEEFAGELLQKERVAVVPGSAFGECGTYHVRCSYATGMDELTEAVARIARFTENAVKNAP
ncbi:MAG: aminotransferase class I/II-fold pyridoxal phosphate-dependent enzyme [Candidatus Gallimonas sp.]